MNPLNEIFVNGSNEDVSAGSLPAICHPLPIYVPEALPHRGQASSHPERDFALAGEPGGGISFLRGVFWHPVLASAGTSPAGGVMKEAYPRLNIVQEGNG
jgi:hypothetical protein